MAHLPYPVLLVFFAMFLLSVTLFAVGLKARRLFEGARWAGLGWAALCVLPFFVSFAYTHSLKAPTTGAAASPAR
jgi:hypothetical protein